MRRHELAVVLVGRHHIDIESFGGETPGGGSYHVVSLETHYHQHRYIESLDDGSKWVKRIYDKLRRLRSVGLVGRIHHIAKSAPGRIETDGYVAGVLTGYEFHQIFGETEEDGGVHSLGIDHRTPQERIVHLKDESVSVYEEKFHSANI